MKHTPGPWRTQHWRKEWHIVGNMQTIVMFKESLKNPTESEANAHLIAAAPEQHEAAYNLAMLVLQSNLYIEEIEVRRAVDKVLLIHTKAEGK